MMILHFDNCRQMRSVVGALAVLMMAVGCQRESVAARTAKQEIVGKWLLVQFQDESGPYFTEPVTYEFTSEGVATWIGPQLATKADHSIADDGSHISFTHIQYFDRALTEQVVPPEISTTDGPTTVTSNTVSTSEFHISEDKLTIVGGNMKWIYQKQVNP